MSFVRHRRRRHQGADARHTSPAAALRAAARLAVESLESRRLLSGTTIPPVGSLALPTNYQAAGTVMDSRGDWIVVGQRTAEASGHENAGRVQLINAATQAVAELELETPQSFDEFGAAVAFLGDGTIAVGAPGKNAVYLFDASGNEIDQINGQAGDVGFGGAVARLGGDRLLIKAGTEGAADVPDDTDAYVRVYNLTTGTFEGVIDADGVDLEQSFGFALAGNADGTRVLAGRREGLDLTVYEATFADGEWTTSLFADPSGMSGAGLAYAGDRAIIADGSSVVIYGESGPTPLSVAGSSLDVDGDRLIVGNPGAMNGDGQQVGATYVFDLTDNSLVETLTPAPLPDGADTGTFGVAVGALSGDRVAVLDVTWDLLNTFSAISSNALVFHVESTETPEDPPVADAGPDLTGVRTVAVNFEGAGSGDTIDLFEWDFENDGTFDAVGQAVSHAFAASGTYTVTLRVTDDDGQTAIDQLLVTISAVGIVDGNLVVAGTGGSNVVTITAGAGGATDVNVDGATTSVTDPFDAIVVYGGDAGDLIVVGGGVTHPAEIYGGAGNDVIAGGDGNDIVVGGDGADIISGGGGRDLLIGGAGADLIAAGAGEDVLIAGTTSHDGNPAALRDILAEWGSNRSYAQRVANLSGPGTASANRLNGTAFLGNDTVFDDGAFDVEIGGAGRDWFFSNNDSGLRDLTVRAGNELVTDIDPA